LTRPPRHCSGAVPCQDADEHVNKLTLHVIQRTAELAGCHFHGGGTDHHQPQRQQRDTTQEQRHVHVEAALPGQGGQGPVQHLGDHHGANLPTAAVNSRPRSSKSANMSRLAQAGDSSTASPRCARLPAALTASSRLLTRCRATWLLSTCSSLSASRPSSTTARQ